MEQLLGDKGALQGEQVAPCLAFVCDLMKDLAAEAQGFSIVLENCQA